MSDPRELQDRLAEIEEHRQSIGARPVTRAALIAARSLNNEVDARTRQQVEELHEIVNRSLENSGGTTPEQPRKANSGTDQKDAGVEQPMPAGRRIVCH